MVKAKTPARRKTTAKHRSNDTLSPRIDSRALVRPLAMSQKLWHSLVLLSQEMEKDIDAGHKPGPLPWGRHMRNFGECYNALLDLKDAMQNPPVGFEPIAEHLVATAAIVREIRQAVRAASAADSAAVRAEIVADGIVVNGMIVGSPLWSRLWELGLKLRAIAWDGISAATIAGQTNDPFDFLDGERAQAVPLEDADRCTHHEIAACFVLGAEAARGRLNRWRMANPSELGKGFFSSGDRIGRNPSYLYRVGAIRHLFQKR